MEVLLAQLAEGEADLQALLDEMAADTTLDELLNSDAMRDAEATLARMLAGLAASDPPA